MLRTDLQCTRCARIVSEGDPDVRFKHGEVIACSACDREPNPAPQSLRPEVRIVRKDDTPKQQARALETLKHSTGYLEDAHREFDQLLQVLTLELEEHEDIDLQLHAPRMKKAENSLLAALRFLDAFKKAQNLK